MYAELREQKQTNILELKNSVTKVKNSIESFKSRLDHAEERIHDLMARTLGKKE